MIEGFKEYEIQVESNRDAFIKEYSLSSGATTAMILKHICLEAISSDKFHEEIKVYSQDMSRYE